MCSSFDVLGPSAENASRTRVAFSAATGRLAGSGAVFGAAAAVAAISRAEGGYEVEVWAPVGFLLILACGALLAAGRRPTRLTIAAAAALLAVGAWSIASTQWGGLPSEAWRLLDESVLAAAALLLGSLLAPATRWAHLVLAGVLAAVTAQAAELLFRPALGSLPENWFDMRTLEGPVGYHNAQASLLALGIPVALFFVGHRRFAARAAAGVAATLLTAAVLLTQSRGGIAVAALGVAVQLLWARDAALVLRVVPLGVAGALLTRPLRDVDAALVTARGDPLTDALASYALWSLLAAAAVGALAAAPLPWRRVRRWLVVALAGTLLAGAAAGIAVELRQAEPFGGIVSLDDTDPNLAPAGETRLASLSLNGRRDAWRVSRDMLSEEVLIGVGQGQFARRWTEERRIEELYLLQPHSLVVELAAELGLVGLGLFALFAGLTVAAVARGPSRPLAAAAIGSFAVVVVQAAVDWTWWFPGLTAPMLAVAGAAAAGARSRVPGVTAIAVGTAAIVAIGLAFAGPYMAQRHLTRATGLGERDLAAARVEVNEALRWNRWDGDAFAQRGRIEEAAGRYQSAAMDYERAIELSQTHWLNRLRQARAYQRDGDGPAWTRACRLAGEENPGETDLRYQLC